MKMIRSKDLADDATSDYKSYRELLHECVGRANVMRIDTTTELINIKVDSQRRSLKGILFLLFTPYAAGARDSGKCGFPYLNKVA